MQGLVAWSRALQDRRRRRAPRAQNAGHCGHGDCCGAVCARGALPPKARRRHPKGVELRASLAWQDSCDLRLVRGCCLPHPACAESSERASYLRTPECLCRRVNFYYGLHMLSPLALHGAPNTTSTIANWVAAYAPPLITAIAFLGAQCAASRGGVLRCADHPCSALLTLCYSRCCVASGRAGGKAHLLPTTVQRAGGLVEQPPRALLPVNGSGRLSCCGRDSQTEGCGRDSQTEEARTAVTF